jgi:hypothetical protein
MHVALIAETVLNRAVFMPSAKEVTGENHVTGVDQRPGISNLVDDLEIFRDFIGDSMSTLEEAVTYVTFMVAGFSEDVEEFIAYTRGMPHFDTTRIQQRGVRCVVVSGNLDQWAVATIQGCRAPEISPIRTAFNRVYTLLCQKGLQRLFEDYRTVDKGRGTFLLEKK